LGFKYISRYQEWNEEIKHIRLHELINRKIVIDKYKAPVTYRNILEAGWDENSIRPKLKKRTDQHGLDALMHSINGSKGYMHVKRMPNEYEIPRILKKIRIDNPFSRLWKL
jgi:hypothetical protein